MFTFRNISLAMMFVFVVNRGMAQQVNLVVDAKASLGEGAIWHPTEKKLYWIDIEGKKYHVYDPATKKDEVFDLPARIGTIVPVEKGGMLLALETGIQSITSAGSDLKPVVHPESDKTNTRYNDGKCDPAGRFWVGTMAVDGRQKAGTLYCIDKEYKWRVMKENVSTSNGITWSADKKTMYYIDTPTGKVEAFDYDITTGNITNSRTAIIIGNLGYPDGSTMDSEGMIWVALWGGSSVTRWNPQTGELLQKIDVPAKNVTSCAFGGKDLKTLYITTARIGTNDEDLKKYPNAGGLFAVRPGVKGVKAYFYKY